MSPPRANHAVGEAMAPGESVSPIVAHVQRLLRSRPWLAVGLFAVAMIVGAVVCVLLQTPQYTSEGAVRIQPVEGTTDVRSTHVYAGFMATQTALATSRPILQSALDEHLRGDGRFASQVAGWSVDALMDHLVTEQPRGTQLIRFSSQNRDPALAQAVVDAVMQSFITSMQREIAAADAHQLNQALAQHEQALGQLDEARQEVARLRERLAAAHHDRSLRRQADAAADELAAPAEPMTAVQIAQTDPQMRQYLDALAVDQMRLADLSNRFAPRHPAVRELVGSIAMQTQRIELYAERCNQARRATASPASTATRTIPNATPPPPESAPSIAQIETDLVAANQHYLNLQNTIDATLRRIDQLRLQSSWKSDTHIVEPANFPVMPQPGSIARDLLIGSLFGLTFALIGFIVYSLIDHRCHTIEQAVAESDTAYALGHVPAVRSADDPSPRPAIEAVHQLRVRIESPHAQAAGSTILITAGQSAGGASELAIALGASLAAARARCLLIDLDTQSHHLTTALAPDQPDDFESILRRDSSLTDQQIDQAVSHALAQSQYVRETLLDLGYSARTPRPLTPQQVRATCDEQLLGAVVELGFLSRSQALMLLQAGRNQSLGLWDVLRGQPLPRCTIGTRVPLLDLLPMTPPSAHTAAALELDAIDRLLQAARSSYDMVLLDASPIAESLIVSALAPRVDSVILSVPHRGSLRKVRRGLQQLAHLGAPPVGIVLNCGARPRPRPAADLSDAAHAESAVGPLAGLLLNTHTADHRPRRTIRRAA